MNNMSAIDNFNILTANMSREELETEIFNLKNVNTVQLKRIEECEQQLYEMKRQLSTSKAMEEHLESEIETLQNCDDKKSEKLTKKVATLEEEIHVLKQKDLEIVQYYVTELSKKDSELENKHTVHDITTELSKEEIDKYTDEIYELKLKINELTDELIESEIKYKDIFLKNTSLENKNTELFNDLRELNECLQIKNDELQENKELVQHLQYDLTIMQMELDNFKSVPLETAAKGNSLFAEVDDNRVKLQKRIQMMNKRFEEMKLQYRNKSQELQNLHLAYSALVTEIENKNDSTCDQSEVIDSYKKHYDNLNDTIILLKKELDNQKRAFTKLISGDMKCALDMISVTRSEVVSLQRKLNSESLELSLSKHIHHKTKQELKLCQTKTMQLRAEVLSLKQTLEEIKGTTSPSSLDNFNIKKSIEMNLEDTNKYLTNSTSVFTHFDFDDHSLLFSDKSTDDISKVDETISTDSNEVHIENKENQPEQNVKLNEVNNSSVKTKKVSFTENTLEPKSTGRLCSKIIKVLPVHIPSIKKN